MVMMMMMIRGRSKELVEWELVGESEALAGTLPTVTSITTNPPWPYLGLNPGPESGK